MTLHIAVVGIGELGLHSLVALEVDFHTAAVRLLVPEADLQPSSWPHKVIAAACGVKDVGKRSACQAVHCTCHQKSPRFA